MLTPSPDNSVINIQQTLQHYSTRFGFQVLASQFWLTSFGLLVLAYKFWSKSFAYKFGL